MHRNTPAASAPQPPIVQWASGHVKARIPERGRFTPHVGFFSEVGQDREFDDAASAAGIGQIEVRHGTNTIKLHWSLGETIGLWPATAGPPATTIAGCLSKPLRAATADAGIGLVWPDGERSRMALRGYILIGDTPALVQLSVSSTMTSHLLVALLDHLRVCQVADQLLASDGKLRTVLPVELALVLGPGSEIAAGRAEQSMVVPLVSTHPPEITRAYLNGIWRTSAIYRLAVAEFPAIVEWAASYGAGQTNGDSHLAPA